MTLFENNDRLILIPGGVSYLSYCDNGCVYPKDLGLDEDDWNGWGIRMAEEVVQELKSSRYKDEFEVVNCYYDIDLSDREASNTWVIKIKRKNDSRRFLCL